jgi:hypothetical protein
MLRKISKVKFLSVSFILFFCLSTLTLASNNYVTLKDLRQDWLVFDKKENAYMPFVEGFHSSANNVGFFIYDKSFNGKKLQLNIPAKTTLRLNDQIIEYYSMNVSVNLDIDSLLNISEGKDFLNFYNSGRNLNELETLLISEDPKFSFLTSDGGFASYFEVLLRKRNGFSNFYMVGVMVLLVALAFLHTSFRRFFNDYFNIGKAYSIRVRNDGFYKQKMMTSVNILFILFLSLALSYLVLSFYSFSNFNKNYLFELIYNNAVGVTWIMLAGIILTAYILKYYFIQMTSSIFLVKDFKKVHYYDVVRMTLIFCTLLVITYIVYYLNFDVIESVNFVVWAFPVVLIFLVFRTIIIFLKLMSLYPYRKLHLFSYLCTTEIIPLLIGLKFFLR